MFTGLVETMGEVVSLEDDPPGVRITLRSELIAHSAQLGDSISVNGCCLTVVAVQGTDVAFEAGEETLRRTNLGELKAGSHVNLERSLKVGDRLGGHLVTGHIDTTATVDQRCDDGQWATFWFKVPTPFTRQMAAKGSVAIDGISLTLVDVEADRFSVALIPHTLDATTLGGRQIGDTVNIETDLLAKYVERQLAGGAIPQDSPQP